MATRQELIRIVADGAKHVVTTTPFPWEFDPYFYRRQQRPNATPEGIWERANAAAAEASERAADLTFTPRIPRKWIIDRQTLFARKKDLENSFGITPEGSRSLVRGIAQLRGWQKSEQFASALLQYDARTCLELAAHDPEVTVSVLGLDSYLGSASAANTDAAKTNFVLNLGTILIGEDLGFTGGWDEFLQAKGTAKIRETLVAAIRERAKLAQAFCLVSGWECACEAEGVIALTSEIPSRNGNGHQNGRSAFGS